MGKDNGINLNTYDLLFNSYNKHTIDIAPYASAIADLGIFTMQTDNFRGNLIKDLIAIKSIRYVYSSNMYKYKVDKDYYVYFNLASEVLDFLSDDDKRELLSSRRRNHCFKQSILLADELNGSMVLFGTAHVGNYQFLHSIVQIIVSGKIYVIDWTLNIVMFKHDYIKLFNFNTISMVSGQNIKENYYLCNDAFFQVPLSLFLTFNQELIVNAKRVLKRK